MDDHHSSVRGNFFVDRTKSVPKNPAEAGAKEKIHSTGQVDIIAMVRSLQRTAGQVDCFRRGNADCDILDCDWRAYCLKGPSEPSPTKRKPKKKR
jgi:hypothetical protein